MKKLFLYISAILLLGNTAYSHSDFYIYREYGNIKLRFKTGYEYEEINKIVIIGKLAQNLSYTLRYSKDIFLDLNHAYTQKMEPGYFIAFNKGNIEYTWKNNEKEKPLLNKDGIFIRLFDDEFDVIAALKLVEFSIKNESFIKSKQRSIEYKGNYCQCKFNTIDTTYIQTNILMKESPLINEVIKTKVFRDEEFKYGPSYYWQNNMYYVFFRDYNNDTELIQLNRIYLMKHLSWRNLFLFDTDSSFYSLNPYENSTSKRHIIKNIDIFYKPFEINSIGDNLVSITLNNYKIIGNRNGISTRTMLYICDKQKLIQDLDDYLKE